MHAHETVMLQHMYRLTFLPRGQNYVCSNVCCNMLHLCSLSDFPLQINVLLPVPVSVLHPHLSPTKMVGNARLTLPVISRRYYVKLSVNVHVW